MLKRMLELPLVEDSFGASCLLISLFQYQMPLEVSARRGKKLHQGQGRPVYDVRCRYSAGAESSVMVQFRRLVGCCSCHAESCIFASDQMQRYSVAEISSNEIYRNGQPACDRDCTDPHQFVRGAKSLNDVDLTGSALLSSRS